MNTETAIRTEDGWHIDQNNNLWDTKRYTVEQAEKFSKTLINCSFCVDCCDCIDCGNCRDCRNCNGCRSCRDCRDCHSCCGCYKCRKCCGCRDCGDCRDCNNCYSCMDCGDCSGCQYCRYCCYCDDCDDCSYCRSCSSFGHNPQRIFGGKMGHRDDIPAVYWIEPGREQCVVGCFRGTLDQLEERVKETHADNPEHLKNYLEFIKKVRAYQAAD